MNLTIKKMDELGFVGKIIGLIIYFFILAAFLGLPLMILWNLVMPDVFGLSEISFLQAVGLNLICGILFRTTCKNK